MTTSKQCFSGIFALFIASVFTASFSGCGGNPNLFHVSGKVTLDGKPVEKAFVTFIPMGGGSTSYGKTDDAVSTHAQVFAHNLFNRVPIGPRFPSGSAGRCPRG